MSHWPGLRDPFPSPCSLTLFPTHSILLVWFTTEVFISLFIEFSFCHHFSLGFVQQFYLNFHRLTSSLYSSLCFYSFKLYLHLLEYADCLTILITILLNSSVVFFFFKSFPLVHEADDLSLFLLFLFLQWDLHVWT